MKNFAKPVWAKKIPPGKIKKLYMLDSRGIYDDELVDEVGIAFYARCDSMLMVSSANLEHPLCIECRTELPNSYQRDFILICPGCGWTITAGEYRDSYKGQTLNGTGALPQLKEYYDKYPAAKTYAEKLRMIDFLLHAFHGDLSAEPSRPIATNMIEGNAGETAKLIYDLAYGEGSTVSKQALNEWLEKFNRSISRNIDPATGKLKEGKAYLYEGIGKGNNPE